MIGGWPIEECSASRARTIPTRQLPKCSRVACTGVLVSRVRVLGGIRLDKRRNKQCEYHDIKQIEEKASKHAFKPRNLETKACRANMPVFGGSGGGDGEGKRVKIL